MPRKAILKRRAHFERLFEGAAIRHGSSHILVRYRVWPHAKFECKMGFVVPKRLGVAVRRNRIKRLLREAYRINQYELVDLLQSTSINFHGVLIAKTLDVDFSTVEQEVVHFMEKIQHYIHTTYDT